MLDGSNFPIALDVEGIISSSWFEVCLELVISTKEFDEAVKPVVDLWSGCCIGYFGNVEGDPLLGLLCHLSCQAGGGVFLR